MWRVVATLALAGGVGWGAEVLDGAVLRTMQRDFPHVLVVARTAVTEELDVAVVLGSPRAMAGSRSFSWSEDESVGLYVQERSRPGKMYALGQFPGYPDCFARVERVTATDTVISCRGEKSTAYPNQKWVYDVRTKSLAGRLAYPPAPMFRAIAREDGVTFNGEGRGIEYRNGEFRVTEAKQPKAMPARGTGPSVREGTRTWFGKSFYAGEGHTGTGGFGFRDAATGESKLFTPPEVVDWSVSAMAVEPEAVWMTLVRRGEWGDQSGGLLRYDRLTGTVRRSPFEDLAHGLAVAGGRVFAATEFGVAVVEGDSVRRYFLDQTLAGRWRVVEAVR